MWGDGLRLWFELFAGMVVYRADKPMTGENEGWLNVNDIEGRFKHERLTFHGKRYDPTDAQQKNALLEAIIKQAGALCYVKLLERRRQLHPPSLDYRVTSLGRRIDSWGYGGRPGIRKRALFFLIETFFRLKPYWKVVTVGATGWVILNAAKFFGEAWSWISNDAFAAASAAAVTLIIWIVNIGLRLIRK